MSEPISPELVLVDPALASAERARMRERDRIPVTALTARSKHERAASPDHAVAHVGALETLVEALSARVRVLEGEVHALEAQVISAGKERRSERLRKRVAAIVLPVSLIANAILIAVAIAESRVDLSSSTPSIAAGTAREELLRHVPQAARPEPKKSNARTRHNKKSPPPRVKPVQTHRARTRAAVTRPTVAAVERKVLAVVVQSPKGKLPPRLIDRRTGLAKNGLQAICRRSAPRSFVCIVRPTHHRPSEGLYVRYRSDRRGGGRFTWYRYRTR